jgi:predicted DNA-binding transcriptional regulator AlpA
MAMQSAVRPPSSEWTAVKAVTGLSKTSLYALIKVKEFPAPVRLGPRAVAWVKSEVRQWALERLHTRQYTPLSCRLQTHLGERYRTSQLKNSLILISLF